jgi:cellulose synthase/poly-beta-1,6-N-acetylglucosamine synthase-like glycosyltransferase
MELLVAGLTYSIIGLSITSLIFIFIRKDIPSLITGFFVVLTGYFVTGHEGMGISVVPLLLLLYLIIRRFLPEWQENAISLLSFGVLSFSFYLLIIQPFLIAINVISMCFFCLELFHILDVGGRKRFVRKKEPCKDNIIYYPKVSIHVPIYKEPVEIVKKTLLSLSRLDYPDYEVCVIVNNTKEEELWRPVEEICKSLGERFKFYHLPQYPGYKAGTLNFALKVTSKEAEIIGIVDSDYVAKPDFLRATVPYFKDPLVAIVQTPQDYREFPYSMIGAYWAYRYFFSVIMNSCNEHNAASFMGTMGLIRKNYLEEIGGWDEEVITEDSELGIRVHDRGWKSIYIDKSFGKGLMPFNLGAYKKQRFRWAFGNMQTLQKNIKRIILGNLTFFQKVCYLGSNTIWFNNLLIPYLLLCISTLLEKKISFLIAFSMIGPYLGFIFSRAIGFIGVLPRIEGISIREGILAFLSFLSITWPMSSAWLLCLIRPEGSFWRTPKRKTTFTFMGFLKETKPEIMTIIFCCLFAFLGFLRGIYLTTILLVINSLIYVPSLLAFKWFNKYVSEGKKHNNSSMGHQHEDRNYSTFMETCAP